MGFRLVLAVALVAAAATPCHEGVRPPVARALLDELFLGNDPMDTFREEPVLDKFMTHVTDKDVDLVLAVAPQPVTFWLELGSYEGGSAIVTAKRVAAQKLETSVIAVDTFLGDARVLWERDPEERRKLLRPDASIALFDRFRTNVHRAGLQSCVLPVPATSVVALKLAISLARRKVAPLPQVIYLDSAHEEGEVLLELDLAWQALPPGGILFGDDWVLPEEEDGNDWANDGATQRDVLRFAASMEAHLDDEWGDKAQSLRTLGRVRPGLFVSYLSFQWFMKKLPNATSKPPARDSHLRDMPRAGFVCWSDTFKKEDCCDEARFGAGGNAGCWDMVYTFRRCCK